MTKLHLLVLLSVFAATLNAQQEPHNPSQDSGNKAIPPPPPATVSSTVKPSTSSHPPTIKPTPKPDPTTPKPSPTPKPTVPPPKPTTPEPTKPTTQPPKPTPTPTPAPPTPTPPPPPKVDPTPGTWVVNYPETNFTCLLVHFAMQIQVPYTTTFNKTYVAPVNVPSDATAFGQCDNDTQVLHLQWNVTVNGSDSVVLTFMKNNTKYQLSKIDVSLTADNKSFPGYNGHFPIQLSHDHPDFDTTVSKSYKCDKQQTLNLTRDGKEAVPDQLIHVSHLQFQAFHNSSNHQFTNVEDCAGSAGSPDVVPIAVGCALAALVIVVLVAYLIGRRRRQARGYLSM